MTNSTPLERHEQAQFVEWLDMNSLLFSATAQSTYTTSWNQKRLNKITGLRKGVPDLLVIIPKENSRDGTSKCLFIEMKRSKGGVVSPEQRIWVDAINNINTDTVVAYVCKGAGEAINTVAGYLKRPIHDVF